MIQITTEEIPPVVLKYRAFEEENDKVLKEQYRQMEREEEKNDDIY